MAIPAAEGGAGHQKKVHLPLDKKGSGTYHGVRVDEDNPLELQSVVRKTDMDGMPAGARWPNMLSAAPI